MALPQLFSHVQNLSQGPETLVNALELTWIRETDSPNRIQKKWKYKWVTYLLFYSVNLNAGVGKSCAFCLCKQWKDSWPG